MYVHCATLWLDRSPKILKCIDRKTRKTQSCWHSKIRWRYLLATWQTIYFECKYLHWICVGVSSATCYNSTWLGITVIKVQMANIYIAIELFGWLLYRPSIKLPIPRPKTVHSKQKTYVCSTTLLSVNNCDRYTHQFRILYAFTIYVKKKCCVNWEGTSERTCYYNNVCNAFW